MKKAVVIFLSLLYLVLSSGFTQYKHFCKGTAVERISLTDTQQQNPDKPCPICTSKEKGLSSKKKDCCKHQSQLVKVDNGIKKQSHFDFSIKFWGEAIPNKTLGALFDTTFVPTSEKQTAYIATKVPVRGNPLFILHCVYRI